MADNTSLNPGVGGDVIATDDIAGVKYQRTKVVWGVDGVANDTSATNPIPVTLIGDAGLTDAQLRLTPVPVSGSFFQPTQPVSGAFFQVTQPVSGSFFQATQPVSGSFFQATQPVSGAFFQTTQPVSGAFFQATQPVSGSVTQIANGVISTANSSIVALAANAVFTGTAEDVTEFADIRVTVFADQASAIDGFQMQQSVNGTVWDVVDSYSIAATTGRIFGVGASAKFFRMVYTNGATAQTAFRLQVKYQKAYGKGSSVRPQDGRARDNDMEEVLSYLMGYNGTGFDMLRSTVANGLAVDVTRTPAVPEMRAATLHVTATAVVNTAITATLPAPAAGLFHYITSVQLVKVYSALGVAAGAGVVITSTNLPGGPAWTTEQAAGAVGTAVTVIDYQPTTPLRSAAAAIATTFAAPAQLQTIWRLNISYFTGP